MQLTRSKIKEYLDSNFKNSTYYKNIAGKNKFEELKKMSVKDLDFVAILSKLLSQIKEEYNLFEPNLNWEASTRQKKLIEITNSINADLSQPDKKNLANNVFLHMYEDFYWEVYDYFDDYNNKNEKVYKEEVDLIIPVIEKFFCIKNK